MQDTATGGTTGSITELQKTKDEAKKQGEEAAMDALTDMQLNEQMNILALAT